MTLQRLAFSLGSSPGPVRKVYHVWIPWHGWTNAFQGTGTTWVVVQELWVAASGSFSRESRRSEDPTWNNGGYNNKVLACVSSFISSDQNWFSNVFFLCSQSFSVVKSAFLFCPCAWMDCIWSWLPGCRLCFILTPSAERALAAQSVRRLCMIEHTLNRSGIVKGQGYYCRRFILKKKKTFCKRCWWLFPLNP